MIVGLVIGVLVLVLLILKTKIHAFLALVLAAAITGIIGGLTPTEVISSITTGFGKTLGSIGIVIGLGVMMGKVLEVSGAARKMALTFLKILGKGKEDWAVAATGYVVSIPIFCDSGFVILTPLIRALSSVTGVSIVTLGIALAIGLVATHHAVPPTPGPLAVAGIFNVDVGLMILSGLVLAIPIVIVGVLYARWLGKRIYQLPDPSGEGWIRPRKEEVKEILSKSAEKTLDESQLPSAAISFAPIVVPILLILSNTALTAIGATGTLAEFVRFLGSPAIAVGIGLIIAVYGLMPRTSREDVIRILEEGMAGAGIIILITGAGGAFGQVLRDSGIGNYIANAVAGVTVIGILLPFIVATLVRLAQGSGTVAMITAASITAPIIANMNVNPVLAAQAATLGAMIFSYFNDSFFWVVNRMIGIKDMKEQIMVWSIPTTLGWLVALIELLIASVIF